MSSSDKSDEPPKGDGPTEHSPPKLTLIVTCQRARDLLRERAILRALKDGDEDGFMGPVCSELDEPTEDHDCDECRAISGLIDAVPDDD